MCRGALSNPKSRRRASDPGSLAITSRQDRFVTKYVTRTKRESSSSSSSSDSSTHTSSSGATHGGGGGSF
ncbi:hypothetical protein [Actinomyces sp. HMT897]|uniref:hypothetical protein n=1 Tax=Actinomyces sp. HMT897 TaxID=2789424 RepID=UPI00190B58F4|nr:hypothetical protein [Actinomyces sp. HMT897]QQO77399.1 hypothetical protein JJJ15_10200 [Actinomyces sp. HMT897]